MNKEKIKIGIVSKGDSKKMSEKVLKKNKLKIFFERGNRELIGKIKGRPNISVSFMHAREILENYLLVIIRYWNFRIRSLERV